MRVDRKLTRRTLPNMPSIMIQSPTLNGLSQKITTPAMKLASVSWAAKPMAKPMMETPVSNAAI